MLGGDVQCWLDLGGFGGRLDGGAAVREEGFANAEGQLHHHAADVHSQEQHQVSDADHPTAVENGLLAAAVVHHQDVQALDDEE